MKLKENELKIFYKLSKSFHHGLETWEKPVINRELDEDLMEVLIKHGYECWASGMEIETRIRDLAFDKGGRKKGNDS